jgi:hypothetical protein
MWKVILQLFFVRTTNRVCEPNPTIEEIDKHMKKNKNYIEYVKDIFYYGDYGEIPMKITYHGKGKLSFVLKDKLNFAGNELFKFKKDVIEHILNESFEDGLYGGGPGSHGVMSTKNKYDNSYEELGLIDCRKKSNIIVEKIESPKSKSNSVSKKR